MNSENLAQTNHERKDDRPSLQIFEIPHDLLSKEIKKSSNDPEPPKLRKLK